MATRAAKLRMEHAKYEMQKESKQKEAMDKELSALEVNPSLKSYLCFPSNKPEFYVKSDQKEILKIPAFGRLFGKGDYKYDASMQNYFSFETIEEVKQRLGITDDAFKKAEKKFSNIFFSGGKLVSDDEKIIKQYKDDKIAMHFIKQAIPRLMQSFAPQHSLKQEMVALLFCAWFEPK